MTHKPICLIKETRQKFLIPKLMEKIGPHINIRPSDKVAIKINLSGSKEIYANTHYETVESLIEFLKEEYQVKDISVIEGSSGAFSSNKTTWDIFYKFRYKEVELNGAKLVNLDTLPHNKTFNTYDINNKRQTVEYSTFDADFTIVLSPPKTHNIFPISASILDILGYIKPEHRALMFAATKNEIKKITSSKSREFSQLINSAGNNFARLYKRIPPSLSIIDGLYGMEGRGPVKGSPVFHGFLIASEDGVLADALTSYVMGFDPSEISYLYHAYREKAGENNWEKVIGAEPSAIRFPYRPHPFYDKQKDWKRKYNNIKNRNHGQNNHNKQNKSFKRR